MDARSAAAAGDAWIMPDFVSVHNGGPNTILRFAHHFARIGAESTIYIFNGCVHQSADQARMEFFQALGAEPRLKVELQSRLPAAAA